jgi:hypothetical protein
MYKVCQDCGPHNRAWEYGRAGLRGSQFLAHAIEQYFSTFFGSWHPFCGTLTMVNYYFEAPMKLIINKLHKEYQQIIRKYNIWRNHYDLFMTT